MPSSRSSEIVHLIIRILLGILVCLLALELVRLIAPLTVHRDRDYTLLAGHEIAYPCMGTFYARHGDDVVLVGVAHCGGGEGTTIADGNGRVVGTFGPLATFAPCDAPGRRCLTSDMTYIALAPDRVPWGRLDTVLMGRKGARSLAGSRALGCDDIAVGDAIEVTGVLGYRRGRVLETGPYLNAADGDHFPCMIVTDARAVVGDSGGPVLVDGMPAGITSRSFSGLLAFTPLAEGLGALGLELCTTPDCGLEPPGMAVPASTTPAP